MLGLQRCKVTQSRSEGAVQIVKIGKRGADSQDRKARYRQSRSEGAVQNIEVRFFMACDFGEEDSKWTPLMSMSRPGLS